MDARAMIAVSRETAIELATAFVIVNGYTEKEPDLMSEQLYFDQVERLIGVGTALAIRHNSIEKTPCEIEEDAFLWYVRFRMLDNSKMARLVCVDKESGEAVQILPEPELLIATMTADEKQQRTVKHIRRATVYRLKGALVQAMQELQHAIQLDPDCAIAYNNLSIIHKLKGEYQEALIASKQAVRLRPNDVEFRNNFGVILTSLGRRDEAIREFWQAVECDPKNTRPYHNLALLYTEFDKPSALLCWEQLYEVLSKQEGREEFKRHVDDAIQKLKQKIEPPKRTNAASPTPTTASTSKSTRKDQNRSTAIAVGIICLIIWGVQGIVTENINSKARSNELSTLNQRIQTLKTLSSSEEETLLTLEKELNQKAERIRILAQQPSYWDEHNRLVDEYNLQRDQYNALYAQYAQNTTLANNLVEKYNSQLHR